MLCSGWEEMEMVSPSLVELFEGCRKAEQGGAARDASPRPAALEVSVVEQELTALPL
jgi:hypothetical protein